MSNSVREKLEVYFASLNSTSSRMMADIISSREEYSDRWETMPPEEQSEVLWRSIVKPNAADKYKDVPAKCIDVEYFPVLRTKPGAKIIVEEDSASAKSFVSGSTWHDEHSAPFRWETQSQIELRLDDDNDADKDKTKTLQRDSSKLRDSPKLRSTSESDSPKLRHTSESDSPKLRHTSESDSPKLRHTSESDSPKLRNTSESDKQEVKREEEIKRHTVKRPEVPPPPVPPHSATLPIPGHSETPPVPPHSDKPEKGEIPIYAKVVKRKSSPKTLVISEMRAHRQAMEEMKPAVPPRMSLELKGAVDLSKFKVQDIDIDDIPKTGFDFLDNW